jgi:multiple sugar transport system ATP-binding protein
MAEVVFEGVTKVFGDGTRAVDKLDLRMPDGEFMVLVGPSGCGKTTALRMLAGLEDITEGVMRIGDRVVNNLSPKSRDIAMVFQSYALYPHLDVRGNLAFPLEVAKVPKREIERRVGEVARLLDLDPYLKRKPRALSGGQRQRVAMGRAIVREPQVFLMDEPLSNLDAKLRVQMRADIKKLQTELGVTTIYVTHDQVEAMTMGHRVAVMRKGQLQQVAPPEELYEHPRNVFVGGFIGSPSMNMLEATIRHEAGNVSVLLGESRIELDPASVKQHRGLVAYDGRQIVLGIRPEGFEDAALSEGTRRLRVKAKAELREALGSEVLLYASIGARNAITEEVRELAEDVGDDRALEQLANADAPRDALIVARLSPRTRVHQGDAIELTIDESALHFFDPETGLAINGSEPVAGSDPGVRARARRGSTAGQASGE